MANRTRAGPRRNKANLSPRPQEGARAEMARGQACETKPIRDAAPWDGGGRMGANYAKGTQFLGVRRDRRANCAKQSQFLPYADLEIGVPKRPLVRNKANLGRSVKLEGSSLKRTRPSGKPFGSSNFKLHTGNGGAAAIVRNKPNSRRARYPTIPLFHRSSIPIRGPVNKQSQFPPSAPAVLAGTSRITPYGVTTNGENAFAFRRESAILWPGTECPSCGKSVLS